MCGRYYVDAMLEKEILDVVDQISRKLQTAAEEKDPLAAGHDVHPSEKALIITSRNNRLTAEDMKWGFSLEKGKTLLINARCESALDKRLFADSVRMRRCVIPARAFYEWDREKNKATFFRESDETIYMAGFYDFSENEEAFVILTTAANESMEPVHDRMPLILEKDQIADWICENSETEALLGKQSPLLVRTQEYEQLTFSF